MADRLSDYRRERDPDRTPEPVPAAAPRPSHGDRFVIQQHHARRLHWDLRLERDGVLASWAVPRGLPRDQGRNHLAVHTEDQSWEPQLPTLRLRRSGAIWRASRRAAVRACRRRMMRAVWAIRQA